jgi:hypothetical protein
MKRFHFMLPVLAALSVLPTSCSKFDLSWLHHDKSCSVQQFNSYYMDASISPYLFLKTYDASGLPKTMDAYVPGVFVGARHFNMKIKYSGSHVYFFDVTSGDSLMKVTLNVFGRPVTAVEQPAFYQGQPEPFPPMRYEFTYVANRLSSVKTIRTTLTTVDQAIYDAAGNLLSFQHPTASSPEGDTYTYDYTTAASRQFYMDIELFSSYLPGFRLLEYLEVFPEFTSPKNLRISHTNAEFSGGFPIFNHMLDGKKKLISYQGGTPAKQFTIIWKCKS